MTDITTADAPIVKPPRIQVGPIAWLRDNLFSSIPNALLTINLRRGSGLGQAHTAFPVRPVLANGERCVNARRSLYSAATGFFFKSFE